MLTVLTGTALQHDIARVRSKDTSMAEFRSAVYRIGLHLAVEASKHLPSANGLVETPLEATDAQRINGPVVLIPVLRAGLGLLWPFHEVLPEAAVGYIGLKRNEETLVPHEYYHNVPPLDESTNVIILDPMLATGGSINATLELLKDTRLRSIMVCCLIAAPEGIAAVRQQHPNVPLIVAQQDLRLDENGFIRPGLGDAGDRLFGT
jgi:uracil phosphoribosyltransferase